MPKGDAAGPVRNETMPSLTGAGAGAAGVCAKAEAGTIAAAKAASAQRDAVLRRDIVVPPLNAPVAGFYVDAKQTRSGAKFQPEFPY